MEINVIPWLTAFLVLLVVLMFLIRYLLRTREAVSVTSAVKDPPNES